MQTVDTSSRGSSFRPQHSRRHDFVNPSGWLVSELENQPADSSAHAKGRAVKSLHLQAAKQTPPSDERQLDRSQSALAKPAFAFANAVVDVSLSSSSLSSSASQHIQPEPEPPASFAVQSTSQQPKDSAADVRPADEIYSQARAASPQPHANAPATGQNAPELQLLSRLDSVKWDQVATWAAEDSAQAAAVIQHLGPCVAESIASDADRDHALLRLEGQVARKKLVG